MTAEMQLLLVLLFLVVRRGNEVSMRMGPLL
jgi:hypothetical protein